MPLLNRQQAISDLIDGAIEACFAERYACAITLAGAAEGAMPKTENGASFYQTARLLWMITNKCSGKEADQKLNFNRNWLKHFDGGKRKEISTDFSWFYVIRAHVQYKIAYSGAEQTHQMLKLQSTMDDEKEPVRVWFKRLLGAAQMVADERARTAEVTVNGQLEP